MLKGDNIKGNKFITQQKDIVKSFNQTGFKTLLNKYQSKVTKTEEFKKWFGNSKVVDENGKPLVV